MYKIQLNRTEGNYELIRNRDGRVMSQQPINNAPIFYPMAYHMAQQQPHATGHLWRAAEEAAAGLVELYETAGNLKSEFDGVSFQVATVNGYEIREHRREPEAVAAPRPKPVYTCNCKFYTEANGKRPIIANMPICKHILAGMMVRQQQIAPNHWQTIAAQQQRGRDSFGHIQSRETRREQEAQQMHEDLIMSNARGKARRAKFNEMLRRQEDGRYKTPAYLAQQEQPF